jgi:hypothetical protein
VVGLGAERRQLVVCQFGGAKLRGAGACEMASRWSQSSRGSADLTEKTDKWSVAWIVSDRCRTVTGGFCTFRYGLAGSVLQSLVENTPKQVECLGSQKGQKLLNGEIIKSLTWSHVTDNPEPRLFN